MVDVSAKAATHRVARASGVIRMLPATLALIAVGPRQEGRRASAWRASPPSRAPSAPPTWCRCATRCRSPAWRSISSWTPRASLVRCTAQVETLGRTGVEMEALTAVQVGLLTVYDMCKAVDRGMVMGDIRLLRQERRQVGRLGRRRLRRGASALSAGSRASPAPAAGGSHWNGSGSPASGGVAGLEELVGLRVAELAQPLRQMARLVQLAGARPAPGPRRSSAACPAGSAAPRWKAGAGGGDVVVGGDRRIVGMVGEQPAALAAGDALLAACCHRAAARRSPPRACSPPAPAHCRRPAARRRRTARASALPRRRHGAAAGRPRRVAEQPGRRQQEVGVPQRVLELAVQRRSATASSRRCAA